MAIDKLVKQAIHSVKKIARVKRASFIIKEKGQNKRCELDPNFILRAFVCVLNNVLMHSHMREKTLIVLDCTDPTTFELFIHDSGNDINANPNAEIFNEFIDRL